jgi:hypothetical protein
MHETEDRRGPDEQEIPANFIEGGHILNGMLKTRNVIEAAIVDFFLFLILSMFHFSSLMTRITVMITLLGPVTIVFLSGINDEPASQYLLAAYKYHKKKSVMLYNHNADAQKMSALDALMHREMPGEKLQAAYSQWLSARQEAALAESDKTEDEFIFRPDRSIEAINAAAARLRPEKPRQEKFSNEITLTDVDDDEVNDVLLVGDNDIFGGDFGG